MTPAFDPAELPYSVNAVWHLRGAAAPRAASCHVIPGYTGLEHLPDMIAIRYLAGKHERDEVVLDHVCRKRRWHITARDARGASLGQVATDDETLMPALAQALQGAVTPAGTVAQVEVHDTDTKTSNVIPAEPRPGPAATVYLLTIAEPDCYPDEYEAGGKVISADIDLNHVFEGAKTARSADEATEFVGNLLWQLEGFPAQLRARAHDSAARAVADYPAALARLDALLTGQPTAPGGADASQPGARA
ncbi:MAG: hypothetical protein HOW97_02975 [Catenulispora sp.]|nr:hypothetical protein [Catenulispora sp.]